MCGSYRLGLAKSANFVKSYLDMNRNILNVVGVANRCGYVCVVVMAGRKRKGGKHSVSHARPMIQMS